MLPLLRVEAIKLRRSLALLVTLACPLMVVLLVFGVTLKQTGPSAFKPATWTMLWGAVTAVWSYFMLPLYIALITCLVNGAEHRNQAWRLMLTLPIQRGQLYLAKFLTAWLLVGAASLLLAALVALAIAILGIAGYPTVEAFAGGAAFAMLKIPLACLPVLVIQHAISWRFPSVVPPLAMGMIATMGIVQIGSSQYWVFYPWSYTLMAVRGGMAELQQHALLLAMGLGATLYLVSALWLCRRESA
ncbi:ABC transporter permease [Cognatiluteimonas telluris]|uniref:ABC transporter permease n=1 Tax=Cognatiluteimonas telluris TaxID=1104775 RepID=UPI001A9C46EA|nr:ABC transporter permease [Lysobacter telluris]